jgi:outer membrane protein TolC
MKRPASRAARSLDSPRPPASGIRPGAPYGLLRSHGDPARSWPLAALAAGVVALSGCASFSADGGFAPVQKAAQEHLGQEVRWARTSADRQQLEQRVAQLLEQPLSMESAVQVALLNNRGLQAAFFDLGIAEADLVQAGRLPNPGFSFGRLTQGDEVELERGLHFDLTRLVAMPLLRQVESRRFAQAQALAATNVLALAADTRKAWVGAVAAEETVRYTQQVMQAAQAGAELARRMAEVGNFNRLQQAREQAFQADAALNLARAQQARQAARERLVRLLGLWGAQADVKLPERLPDLPAAPRELPDVERLAIEQRLDVQGARLAVEQTARNLGLSRATRFVNVLELGLLRNSSNEAPVQRGWEIGFEIPLFDWGTSRVAKAESVYMQAAHRAAEAAIEARSEVREAYGAYRFAWDMARHQRDEIVPLRQRIAEENMLRYNGMLIGVFELLADARAQIASVNGAIDALRDFWLAQADLDMALVGKPGNPGPMAAAALGTPAADGGGGH